MLTPGDAYDFMHVPELREIAVNADQGGARAFNAGNYRLALIGFGCALEALLVDWLLTLSESDLAQAVAVAPDVQFRGRERQVDPRTWDLANLIRVVKVCAATLQ